MSKGQIPYARTGKRRQSENIGKKTEQDITIYDQVEKDMSPDFLAYINELVKPVKGKPAHKPLELDIQPITDSKVIKQPIKNSRRSSIDKDQVQNYRLATQGSKSNTLQLFDRFSSKKLAEKPKAPTFFGKKKSQEINQLKKTRNIEDLLKTKTNLINKNLNIRPSSNYQSQGTHTFLQKMDQYVHNLQKQTNHDDYQKPKIMQLQQTKYQNKMLKNKLKQYEMRFQQIQLAVTQMLEYSKKRQKQLKKQINELNKALISAVEKINDQKQEIDYLRDFISSFSQQLQTYNDGRLNKHKLEKLLNEKDYDQKRISQTLLKSIRYNLVTDRSNNSNQDQKIYHGETTPMYMPSRSKTSSNIVHKFNISKSNSKDSRQLKSKNRDHYLKNKFIEYSDDTEYQK